MPRAQLMEQLFGGLFEGAQHIAPPQEAQHQPFPEEAQHVAPPQEGPHVANEEERTPIVYQRRSSRPTKKPDRFTFS